MKKIALIMSLFLLSTCNMHAMLLSTARRVACLQPKHAALLSLSHDDSEKDKAESSTNFTIPAGTQRLKARLYHKYCDLTYLNQRGDAIANHSISTLTRADYLEARVNLLAQCKLAAKRMRSFNEDRHYQTIAAIGSLFLLDGHPQFGIPLLIFTGFFAANANNQFHEFREQLAELKSQKRTLVLETRKLNRADTKSFSCPPVTPLISERILYVPALATSLIPELFHEQCTITYFNNYNSPLKRSILSESGVKNQKPTRVDSANDTKSVGASSVAAITWSSSSNSSSGYDTEYDSSSSYSYNERPINRIILSKSGLKKQTPSNTDSASDSEFVGAASVAAITWSSSFDSSSGYSDSSSSYSDSSSSSYSDSYSDSCSDSFSDSGSSSCSSDSGD